MSEDTIVNAGTEAAEDVRTTVMELGATLPIGCGPVDGTGVRQRGFRFSGWTGADERVIGAYRANNKRMSQPEFAAWVLSHFAEDWGGNDMTRLKDREAHALVKAQPAADVFHAWVTLRIQALGKDYKMGLRCPACDHTFSYTIDLEEIEVTTPAAVDQDLHRSHVLKDGFSLTEGGGWFTTVTIAPLRWATYCGMLGSSEATKRALISGAVVGLPGYADSFKLPGTVLDQLTKRDIESLTEAIAEDQHGPDLHYEAKCPGCEIILVRTVEWVYDPFF